MREEFECQPTLRREQDYIGAGLNERILSSFVFHSIPQVLSLTEIQDHSPRWPSTKAYWSKEAV